MTPFEVDADYVWALEVLVCYYIPSRDDPPSDDVGEARRITNQMGLDQPMDRIVGD